MFGLWMGFFLLLLIFIISLEGLYQDQKRNKTIIVITKDLKIKETLPTYHIIYYLYNDCKKVPYKKAKIIIDLTNTSEGLMISKQALNEGLKVFTSNELLINTINKRYKQEVIFVKATSINELNNLL